MRSGVSPADMQGDPMSDRPGIRVAAALAAAWFSVGAASTCTGGVLEDAQAALDRGDAAAAYEGFMAAVREQPDNPAASLGAGLAALSLRKYGHAQAAFERVLAMNPNHQRARLELARTYHALGLTGMARGEFEAVLRAGPPAPVEANIRRYLARLDAEERTWGFTGEIRLTAFYDDNANYGPSSMVVDTLLGPLQVAPRSEPLDVWGTSVALIGHALYDMGGRGGWFGTGGLSLYNSFTEHSDEVAVGYGRATLGLRHVASRREIDLPVKVDYFGFGNDPLLWAAGVEPGLVWRPLESWSGAARVTAEHRDYEADGGRDAGFYRAGGYLTHRPGRDPRNAVSLLAAAFLEDADAEGYRNEGIEAGVLLEAGLPWRTSVYGFALYRGADYDGILFEGIQPAPRDDDQWQFGGGVRTRWGGRWETDLGYRHVRNESTFELYEYERNVVSLGVSYFLR